MIPDRCPCCGSTRMWIAESVVGFLCGSTLHLAKRLRLRLRAGCVWGRG